MAIMTKRRLSLVPLALAAGLAACTDTVTAPRAVLSNEPGLAAADGASTVTLPLSMAVWVPCANGGTGELVDLTGELVIKERAVTENDGSVRLFSMTRPHGVRGVGQETGVTYLGTGMGKTTEHIGVGGYPYQYTYVNNFRIIGQGPGNNLLVHATVHKTINANGEPTADVDLLVEKCQ